ncbi:hypothetical protein [Deinococcus sp. LM3]|uniref:hypothetical protein n=1 Tax=Deinococcus sp. LM3 TaxID=1938608 RepID=UPI00117FF70B|nr:hypothetical protein [Deinococcus sp. LM3]
MTHAIVLSVISKVLPGEAFADRAWWIRVGVVLIYAALIAGAAVATYHVVERPARERLKPRPVTMQVEPVVT